MRLLLDQNVPFGSAALLRELGHDAVHADEVGMRRSSDEEHLRIALLESRVIATQDADFHAILARRRMLAPSVIRLRLETPSGREVATLLHYLCSRFIEDLEAGCALSTDGTLHRVRRLPLE